MSATTTERVAGPRSQGRPTFSGKAGEKTVFWIGDQARADELERRFQKASPLGKLLIRSEHTREGLTQPETLQASKLMEYLPTNDADCPKCIEGRVQVDKTIGDTNMCKGHCRMALDRN